MTVLDGGHISVPQVAQELGVHRSLVYREIKAGRLPALRVGTKVLRVSREALAAYQLQQAEALRKGQK